MKKTLIKIIGGTLGVFALMQLIPVDRENKPVRASDNFVDLYKTPAEVRTVLKKACYDCHSNETIYPKYAYIAPLSWSIKEHVNEGREHLNFSEWGTFNKDIRRSMLKNTVLEVKENKMPLLGYVAQHPEARMSEQDKKMLEDYFQNILDQDNY